MPFSVHWMERDSWQLVTSQGTDCTDDEYRLAEKIILRIGPRRTSGHGAPSLPSPASLAA